MATRGMSGMRADCPSSYRRLETIAARVREQIHASPDQAVDTLRLFEDLSEISLRMSGGKELPLGSGVIPLEGSEGYARYDTERDILEVLASERTYDRLERHHPRAGYFVAHELGHCILHANQLVRLARMPTMQQAALHRRREGHKPYQDTEWQANAFASAFLMPAIGMAAIESVRGELTVPLVADRFGVSREAAGYRLQLYSKRKVELCLDYNQRGGCNAFNHN